ncbi:MAG: hypothetical protein AAGE13_01005 [Pseudomonadota bacterium]
MVDLDVRIAAETARHASWLLMRGAILPLRTVAAAMLCAALFAALGALGVALMTAAWRDRGRPTLKEAMTRSAPS